MLIIKNAMPLVNGKFIGLSQILIGDNGKIADIGSEITCAGANVYDAKGAYAAAGYVDIHTHGGNGHDFMEATTEAIDAIASYHLSTGTTSFCPTTLTAGIDETIAALEVLRNYQSTTTARRLGAHLEGPFISPKAPGAHPPRYIISPTADNTKWLIDNRDVIERMTIAPDIKDVDFLAALCQKYDINMSLGHDASIDDEIYYMVDKGANSITHMTNCTSKASRRTSPHKHLGLTEVGMLSDKITCEVIADQRHVPNDMVKLLYKLKTAKRIALVSDSLAVAGMGNVDMFLGSGESKQRIKVVDGVAILPDLNIYAGSVTPISAQVQNLVKNIGIPLDKAVTMGSATPSKVIKAKDRGVIKVGCLGDINIMNADGKIIDTILGGKLVAKANN